MQMPVTENGESNEPFAATFYPHERQMNLAFRGSTWTSGYIPTIELKNKEFTDAQLEQ
jgi:hypothetical protein